MNDPTAEDVLKKTFEHLEEVLEEQNDKNQNGTGDLLHENEYRRNKEKNDVLKRTQG